MAARHVVLVSILGAWFAACAGAQSEPRKPAPPPARPVIAAPKPSAAPTATPDAGVDAQEPPRVATRECGKMIAAFAPFTRNPPDFADGTPHPAAAWPLAAGSPSPALAKLCEKLKKAHHIVRPDAYFCYARSDNIRQGVFAIATEHPNPDKPSQYWHLVYMAPSGTVSRSVKVEFSDGGDPAAEGGQLPSVGSIISIADFNADGRWEVVTKTSRPLDSSATPGEKFEIWTVKGRRIVPYAPAKKLRIVQVVDEDADGLPDPVIDPHGILVGSPYGWSGASWDWTLIAHALPNGSFSQTDSVAKRYAKKLCPQRPELPAAFTEPACFGGVVHCARLWGVDEKTLVEGLKRGCKDEDPRVSLCNGSMNAWISIAHWTPPFVLGSD